LPVPSDLTTVTNPSLKGITLNVNAAKSPITITSVFPIVKVQILGLNGMEVWSTYCNDTYFEIEKNKLINNYYIIQVTTENEVFRQKIAIF
jgi:hypothetical protein